VSNTNKGGLSRRDVMKKSGKIVAASALAGVVLPQVHAAENNTIKLALVGCGGRGTGAAGDAMSSRNGPTQLVAMADIFPERIRSSYDNLHRAFAQHMDVPEARRFIGFDAYRHAMDCLRPGDVVILTTPPAFRWVHFTYAIQRGLNVFMEKPITVDGPSTRRMFRLADESERRGLKVGVGLMCRHCLARKELARRLHDGAIGDITMLRCYRMHGPVGHCFVGPKPSGISELLWQVREFHSFLWASGGLFSDFYIHNIDECCWMKDAWPVKAEALGGRHYRGNNVDQNFDTYSVEYTFADGAKLFLEGRTMTGCHQAHDSYAHGTRGSAVISEHGHFPTHARIFRNQQMTRSNITWQFGRPEPSPYQLEWDDLLDAIRHNRPYNEVRRGAEASLITCMGRMAAHTGQVVTRDQMLNCDHEFAPTVDQLTMDGPAPLRADAQGRYPVPEPGRLRPHRGQPLPREYEERG
jgi:predicted dehydrogenase